MTTYFAFKLADATQQGIDELLANLDSKSAAPQHALHTRVSVELTDEILKHCVEELMARFQGEDSAGILHTLLGLLKGTAHVLVKQMLGKGSNEEVAKMAQYLRGCRVLTPAGEVRYGFVLPAKIEQGFEQAFAGIAAGNGKEQRAALHSTMLAFGDEALVRFYDDFVGPMDLGFIKRKASDLGRSTIHKGVQVAMNKLIPNLNQKQLEIFADYYGSLLVKA